MHLHMRPARYDMHFSQLRVPLIFNYTGIFLILSGDKKDNVSRGRWPGPPPPPPGEDFVERRVREASARAFLIAEKGAVVVSVHAGVSEDCLVHWKEEIEWWDG